MKKFPETPESIFTEYTADWQTAFGREVEAIILYGSAARGEYVAGKSDINFLVILTSAGMLKLRQAVEITQKWRARNVQIPRALTRDYMRASLDSFPVEFLDMKLHHRVVSVAIRWRICRFRHNICGCNWSVSLKAIYCTCAKACWEPAMIVMGCVICYCAPFAPLRRSSRLFCF